MVSHVPAQTKSPYPAGDRILLLLEHPYKLFHGYESPLHPSNQRRWWQDKLESLYFPIRSLVINMLFFVALHVFLGYLPVSSSLKDLWQQRNSNVTVAA